MHQIDFYLDFVSPYAYLAFERLPEVLQGHSYQVTYRPILFAGLLKHHGQRGPAEIGPKRDWTYRQVLWLASRHGIEMQLPSAHPFNPLALLRLAVASSDNGLPNRFATEVLLRHVWQGGADASDPMRLRALHQQLAPRRDPAGDAVKAQLRAFTDDAVTHGVFGVPTMQIGGKWFWGLDALPMLRSYLDGDAWFDCDDWDAVRQLPAAVQRRS